MTDMNAGVLIVGAGQAGVQLAVTLRDSGYPGAVTLVGAEPHAPYQRPPLSKAFLTGRADAAGLAFRTPGFYAQHEITLVCGERVNRITADAAGSGVAEAASGRTFGFTRLALAVGGRSRRIDVAGAELDGICYLRDVADARRLRERLAAAARLVVVGGGFIGLEIAAVARARGKNVTVVEAEDRLLARAVAPVTSEFYCAAHRRRGTEVRLGAAVTGFLGADGRVAGVELADGAVLPADLVLVSAGMAVDTGLAEQLGLACDRGIVVDELARTSNAAIVAAGDCTTQRHRHSTGMVRLESVQNAVDQARTAALTVAGAPRPYRDVPWFWSDQDTLKLQIAGLSGGYDRCVVRGDPGAENFSALYYRRGQLIAAECVNRAADYLAVRRALSQGMTIPPGRAADTDLPLKTLTAAVA